MEANQLRLILLLVGIILVALVYFWETYKYRRNQIRLPSKREEERIKKELEAAGAFEPEESIRVLKTVPQEEWQPPELRADKEPAQDLPEIKLPEHKQAHQEQMAAPEPDEWMIEQKPSVPDKDEDSYLAEEPKEALKEEPPVKEIDDQPEKQELILQILLETKSGHEIKGTEIKAAMQRLDIIPGDMDLYHYYEDESQEPVFSIANSTDPGYFPFDDMVHFRSTGLILFARLPSEHNGVKTYNRMLHKAAALAELFNADLYQIEDRKKEILEPALIEATHQRILALEQ